jgi:hypothetical protein
VFPFGKAKAFSLEKTLGAVLQPKDPGRMGPLSVFLLTKEDLWIQYFWKIGLLVYVHTLEASYTGV